MAVILVADKRYETLAQTVQHLCQQTAKDQLELVFVVCSKSAFHVDEQVAGFCNVRVVEIGEMRSLARAHAAGILAATTPLVVFAENHSFPEPNWAGALINAHQHSWAAVGPAVNLGNPRGTIASAIHLLTYDRWSDPVTSGVVDDLPGHNSSYKRSILLAYGDELENMLHAETLLHWDLRRLGYQLYLEPAAKTTHYVSSRFSTIFTELFTYGRMFAAARARKWNLARRFLFGAISPLIPLIRLKRTVMRTRRLQERAPLFGILAAISLGSLASSAGEMLGYLLGSGNSIQEQALCELNHPRELQKK